MKLESLKTLADRMVEGDTKRDEYFRAYLNMFHGAWKLPSELEKVAGIHKVVSSIPHDAITTAVRVVPGGRLVLRMTPLAGDPDNKARANEIERILKWQLKAANDRRQQPVQAEYMQSACLYATIAAQVVDVPWQIKQLEGIGGNTNRWTRALRYGRFMVNVFNPLDVHARYSGFMPECVLLDQIRTAQSVLDEFGKKANKLTDLAEAGLNVRFRDIMDYDRHRIWCEPQDGGNVVEIITEAEEKHELPFLPWVALMGGSSLESAAEHAYHSLLYPVHASGQWESQNTVDTMRMSQAIWNWAKPFLAEEGPMTNNASTEYNAVDATGIAYVTPGDTLKALPQNQIDPALSVISDVLGGRQTTSTVSQILMNGEVPQGAAFSSINLMVLTAIGALKPYKELTEHALSETFKLMLEWSKFTDEPLQGFGMGKADKGAQYVLDVSEIPEQVYLDVELKPDTPTDMQSKANTAIMLMNSGLMDAETALEELGVEDPQQILENIVYDQMTNTYTQLLMQQWIQDMSGPTPEELAQQEANAQGAAQAEMATGQGMMTAPPMGGEPYAQVNPNMTRETVNQMDMTGNPLAQGMGI